MIYQFLLFQSVKKVSQNDRVQKEYKPGYGVPGRRRAGSDPGDCEKWQPKCQNVRGTATPTTVAAKEASG